MRPFTSLMVVAAAVAALVSCTDSAGDKAAKTGTAGTTGAAGNGGATGSGGTTGAAGAPGSGGGTALARVFASDGGSAILWPLLKACDASGACPEGQTCFRLTADVAVCDVSQRAVKTTCSFDTDECECTGRTCDVGRVCVTVNVSSHDYNTCLEPACTSPSDCGGGSVCTPASLILGAGAGAPAFGRCFTPGCRSDADCTGGQDGRCALVILGMFGADRHMEKVGCVFAGEAASATACAPSQATEVRADPSSPSPPYYTCAGR